MINRNIHHQHSFAMNTKQIKIYPLLLLCLLLSWQWGHTQASQQVAFSALSQGTQTTLNLAGNPMGCTATATGGYLLLRLSYGEPFLYATDAISYHSSLTLDVDLQDAAGSITVKSVQLDIDQAHPSQVTRIDYGMASRIPTHFVVTVSAPPVHNAPTFGNFDQVLLNATSLNLLTDEAYAWDGSGATISNAVAATDNPSQPTGKMNFSWTADCPYPQYEFQLLRLWNYDPLRASNPTSVAAQMDWTQGLRMIVDAPNVTLTPAQGEGFYIWRARPTGNATDGGASHSDNWGNWPPTQGGFAWTSPTILIPEDQGSSPYIFHYDDLNLAYNYTFQRRFSGNSKVHETQQYYSDLLQPVQSQRRLSSQDKVVLDAQLYDYNGQPALNTLPIPVDNTDLGYRSDVLVTDDGGGLRQYLTDDFDADATYLAPTPLTAGQLGNFFSSTNPDTRIPDAEGFPFARTRYLNDGTQRTAETSLPGSTYKMGSQHTTRHFYASVSDAELTSIFGHEAPAKTTVDKLISVNADGVVSYAYRDKSGQTLATCLSSYTPPQFLAAGHEPPTVPQPLIYTPGVMQIRADGSLFSQATFFASSPMDIHVDYSIEPEEFELACPHFCNTCNYEIEIRLRQPDGSLIPIDQFAVEQDTCWIGFSMTRPQQTQTITQVGTYAVEKIIRPNRPITTNDPQDPINGARQLPYQIELVNRELDRDPVLQTQIEDIYNFLDNVDVDQMYGYLATQVGGGIVSYDAADKAYHVQTACCDVRIPDETCWEACPTLGDELYDALRIELVKQCNDMLTKYPGPAELASWFIEEDFFLYHGFALVAHSTIENIRDGIIGGTDDIMFQNAMMRGNPEIYQRADFVTLVDNMLGEQEAAYTCARLRACWYTQLDNLLETILRNYMHNRRTDFVKSWISCLGYRYKGTSSVAMDPTAGWKSHAYAYFEYVPTPQNQYCQTGFEQQLGPMSGWADDQWEVDENKPYYGRHWEAFYECLHGNVVEGVTHTSPNFVKEIAETECLTACQERAEIFAIMADTFYDHRLAGQPGLPPKPEVVSYLEAQLMQWCESQCNLTITIVPGLRTDPTNVPRVGNLQDLGAWLGYPGIVTTVTGVIEPGELYRIVVTDGDIVVNYNHKDYGHGTENGAEFYGAAGFPDLRVRTQSGGEFHLVRDNRQYDRVGFQSEIELMQKVISYDAVMAIGPACTGASFTINGPVTYGDWANDLIINSELDGDGPVASGPLDFGKDGAWITNTDWQHSHGNPKTVHAPEPDQTDRAAEVAAWNNLVVVDGTDFIEPFNNGIMTKVPFQLDTGSTYHIRMDMKKVPDKAVADRVLVLIDPAVGGRFQTNASSVSTFDPALNQLIATWYDISNENWRTFELEFEMELPTGAYNLVIFPLQDIGGFGPGTAVDHDDVTVDIYDLDPGLGPHFEHLTAVNVDNVELAESIDWLIQAVNDLTVCFNWVKPFEHVDPLIPTAENCEEDLARRLRTTIENQLAACRAAKAAELTAIYETACQLPASIDDNLEVTVSDYPLYHFTLFYYDLNGHLIKTVPPKGVDRNLTYTRTSIPAHQYVTHYAYDNLGNLIRKETVDGGATVYYYDKNSRLRFSQDAQQAAEGIYSYSKYDGQGRVIEAGTSNELVAQIDDPIHADNPAFPATFLERNQTHYGIDGGVTYAGLTGDEYEQQFLQNRVSFTETSGGARRYYSYDIHGNVAWMAIDIPGMAVAGTDRRVYVRYDYDLFSGQVLQIRYNEYGEDRFFVRYAYDADERIRAVETSRDGVIWDKDAGLTYFDHGGVKRVEIGQDVLQGMDFTYNLHGQLKAINHRDPAADPGNDGSAPGAGTLPDQFGMVLGYYDGDFKHTGSAFETDFVHQTSTYAGQIAAWEVNMPGQSQIQYAGESAQTFRYDPIGRLQKSKYHTLQGGSWTDGNQFKTTYDYDPNGNLTAMKRWEGTGTRFDDLSYVYDDQHPSGPANNNRLLQITDASPHSALLSNDLESQAANNYTYDADGRLISDDAEAITDLQWNYQDKLASVTKTLPTPGQVQISEFAYDAAGHRISKMVRIEDGGTEISRTTTFYVRDGAGRVLAIYRGDDGQPLVLAEQPVLAGDRIGMVKPELTLTTNTYAPNTAMTQNFRRELGLKSYELTDHLNNTRVRIGDRKLASYDVQTQTASWSADLLSSKTYFPYGMEMPGRSFDSDGHRYGFQGMEEDAEVNGDGNSYTTYFRQYDPRVGRWLSIDPEAEQFPSWSPYKAFNDNPIRYNDPDGGSEEEAVLAAFDLRFFPRPIGRETWFVMLNDDLSVMRYPAGTFHGKRDMSFKPVLGRFDRTMFTHFLFLGEMKGLRLRFTDPQKFYRPLLALGKPFQLISSVPNGPGAGAIVRDYDYRTIDAHNVTDELDRLEADVGHKKQQTMIHASGEIGDIPQDVMDEVMEHSDFDHPRKPYKSRLDPVPPGPIQPRYRMKAFGMGVGFFFAFYPSQASAYEQAKYIAYDGFFVNTPIGGAADLGFMGGMGIRYAWENPSALNPYNLWRMGYIWWNNGRSPESDNIDAEIRRLEKEREEKE